MFERLRRAMSGGSTGRPAADRSAIDRLAAFDAGTPHRFRTWLADSTDRERLATLLSLPAFRDVAVELIDEPDGRVRLEVATATGPRWPRTREPLDALHAAGITVRGFEPLDLVTDVGDDELRRTVEGASREPIDRPFGRRLDALAGEALYRRCLAEWSRLSARPRRPPEAFGWRRAAVSAASNTPAGEAMLLRQALEISDGDAASWFVSGADARVQLCVRVGATIEVDESTLLALVRRRGQVGNAALELIAHLPAPLSDGVVGALCTVARRGRGNAVRALIALRRAPPTPDVVRAVEAALEADDPDAPGVALETLAQLIGTGARPAWQRFLDSRSAYRRLDAEVVIGKHGDADDVPLAATALAKLIRSKPATETLPPRAWNFITLLVRHRDEPAARAALADLTARWLSLSHELRAWIAEREPSLMPAGAGSGVPGETPAAPGESVPTELLPDEEQLQWPAPTVNRRGDAWHLEFAEMDRTVRDHFQDLIEADPRITVVDGDRDWLTLRIGDSAPEAVVAAHWAAAHERGS